MFHTQEVWVFYYLVWYSLDVNYVKLIDGVFKYFIFISFCWPVLSTERVFLKISIIMDLSLFSLGLLILLYMSENFIIRYIHT